MFLAGGGRRLTVCELCTPRAAHEGWRRESAHAEDLGLSPARPRRARNLLGRLRQLREPAGGGEATAPPAEAPPSPSTSASAQTMAEEFEPVEPLHGASEPPHSTAAPVAAPVLEETTLIAGRLHGEVVEAESLPAEPLEFEIGPVPEDLEDESDGLGELAGVGGSNGLAEPGEPDELDRLAGADRPAGADGLAGADRSVREDEPVEEGSWRDAWMFVGE